MKAAAKRPPFTGSIRGKLMAFTALLCVVLIALLWVLNAWLLEPVYHYKIRASLNFTADVFTDLIEQYGTLEDAGGVNADFYMAASKLVSDEQILSGQCLDIGDANGYSLLRSDQIQGSCLLHPFAQNETAVFGERPEREWNSFYIIALRRSVLKKGQMTFILHSMEKEQMVTCRRIGTSYTVIVSADLERIGESARVMGTMMPLIALVVLVLGLLGAFFFSRWFARPLSEISKAARAVAAGDYSVSVTPHTKDEIGTLAQDFNTMTREVAASAQLQRDLIANISHDLRTPLTLIKGYAETIRDLTGDDKEKRESQLNVIVDETDRLSGLVNSVMELSKMSSGAEKPQCVTFDLAQLCEETAYRYMDICEKNGYVFEVETSTPCEVYADPDMLGRVLHNLLGNALHHIGENHWMALRCIPLKNGAARVEVADRGEGISAEDIPYIFDRYYRTRASAGKAGTGLGLSITKAVLTSHDFPFGVSSTLGGGSTFWFEAHGKQE